MPATQTAETPVTIGALQAIMNSFKLEMRAMIAKSRSRPSSPTPQQLSSPPTPQAPPQSDSSATVTQQQPSPAKKKRNQKTRQQYKRRALHTVQPSVKEVEHTEQTKPREHIVSERIKLVPWGWSTTSLWCWHVVIPWDGMTMILVLWCGASGMPRIGIGWSLERSDGPYLNDLEPSEVLVPQLFGCIYSILDPSAGNTSNPGEPVGFTPAVGLTLPFFSACAFID